MLSDEFNGAWVQVDGDAEVLDMPEAEDALVDYFRSISGEHPDWDEYRAAMRMQGKSLIRITPDAMGGPDRLWRLPPRRRRGEAGRTGRLSSSSTTHVRRRRTRDPSERRRVCLVGEALLLVAGTFGPPACVFVGKPVGGRRGCPRR